MNYYNEYDPKAAAWLRELIAAKMIPAGVVDERSITEIKPHELSDFTQCHFFAGIGGWSYALQLAGWPATKRVWTGSCPCQPFSDCGKRMGRNDPRHLWPAFRRLINRAGPTVVFGEQVASAAGRKWLAGVFANLETMGYAAAGADLCAAGVHAPHIRQRLYWVADSSGERCAARSRTGGAQIGAWMPSDESESNSVPRRMADASDVRWAQHERESREWEIAGPRDSSERAGFGGVGNTIVEGLEGYAWDEYNGDQPGRINVSVLNSSSLRWASGAFVRRLPAP